MEKAFKIGIDIHGVADSKPEFFKELTRILVASGWEVHLITGTRRSQEEEVVRELGISFTHFFSITDYHTEIGTDIRWDEKNEPHLDPYLWDKTKAEYCERTGIDLHLDDSDIYQYFFKTPYARFFSKDSHRIKKTKLQ